MDKSSKPETLSDMLPPQDELEADLARLAEVQALRAENKRLKEAVTELGVAHLGACAENERLRAALEWVRDDTELWDAPVVLEALGVSQS